MEVDPHFCFISNLFLCYWLFSHILLGTLREKNKGWENQYFPTNPSPSTQRRSRSGGSLAFSLHITVDSEKRPDTLSHCQSLTCFVSTSAAVSLGNILDSSLSAHSLLQDIPWSAITRQCVEYNANSSPWHPRSSRIWLTRDSPFQVRKKHILLHFLIQLARNGL